MDIAIIVCLAFVIVLSAVMEVATRIVKDEDEGTVITVKRG